MEEFKWKDSYSVGNEDIDRHHKKLLALFNELALLIEKDDETHRFSSIKVISELNVYAVFHFKKEEKLMEAGNYNNLDKHKELHKDFIAQVNKFKDNYFNNDPLVNYEMFNYLSNWILTHVLVEDAKYIDYI